MPPPLNPAESEPVLATHLREVRAAERASFHMPGHRGGAGAPPTGIELLGSEIYAADLSEMGGFDYLHGPTGPLREATERAASAFGAARTWFLVNGATVGNLAALGAVVRDGDAVLCARASHRSVYAGLVLAGARPHYLPPVANERLDGLFGVDPDDVASTLAEHSEICAVHVTNPSYYGFTVDLAQIAAHCHAAGVPLVVDEAHGTHFAFDSGLPSPALAQGADLVVHSPHKTLGSLTQSSLLHCQGDLVDTSRLDGLLQMLQSSSPSALLLVSLDCAIAEAAASGGTGWARARHLAAAVRDRLSDGLARPYGSEIVGMPGIHGFDPTKLVVDVAGLETSGLAAASWLKRHRQVNPEFADLRRIVFSLSHADDEASAALLAECVAALDEAELERHAPADLVSRWPVGIPERQLSPRVGTSAPAVAVATPKAAGRIAAEMLVPYPPGVPLLVPGELVGPEVIDAMSQLQAAGCRFVGTADPSGATLRCVA